MSNIDVVGLDLGYDFIKVVIGNSKDERIMFPSVHTEKDEKGSASSFMNNSKFDEENIEIEFQGVDYFLGQRAIEYDLQQRGIRDFSDEYYKEPYNIAKFLAGVALLDNSGDSEIVINTLITGLSCSLYDNLKKDVIRTFNEDFKFKVPGQKEKTLIVKDVKVMPQAVGAFYNYTRNFQGQKKPNVEIPEVYGVIDIGGRTTDVSICEGFELRPNSSFGLNMGMKNVFSIVKREYGLPLNIVEKTFIEGNDSVTYNTQTKTIGNSIKQEIQKLAKKISKEVINEWDSYGVLNIAYLSGGGSKSMSEHLKNNFKRDLRTFDDPQFGNALGYYKLGMYLVSKKRAKREAK
jgi:plasmid segregation protein ParM